MEAYYSTREMADMIFCYGLANGRSLRARVLYVEKFPNRRVPSDKLFTRLFQRLRDTGSLSPKKVNSGRPRSVRTPEMEERVLNLLEERPSTSVRRLAAAEGVSHSLVWGVLHEQLLYPYHVQRVQALRPEDHLSRLRFCQWLLQKCAVDPLFSSTILFTDEAGFTRDGVVNFHNQHVWADENPHEVAERGHQHRFSINVWAGILGDRLIGPYILPHRLNGAHYHQFLVNVLPALMDDVSYQQRLQMWFMHDGAPAHFHRNVREHLTLTFGDHWIGRGGPTPWPSRSPDFNPLDFWLWGHLKTIVYATPVNDVQTLQDRVFNACRNIQQQPGVFQRVRDSLRRRAEGCIAMDGRHIEHLL